MAVRKWTLIALMVIGSLLAVPANAFATNGHQDHQGACARSTTSISEGVSDLQFNGVLEEFANAVGIHGFDGSLTKQMDEQLVVGKIAKAVDTENTGCDGAGGIFDAGIRHLYKGEEVALKAPAKFGKEVCRHPSAKCKKIRITVHVVFPLSCWNKNHQVTIEVFIWVRKPKRPHHHHHKHHHHHHKCGCKTPPPPPSGGGSCNGNNVNNGTGSAGNCNICTGVNVCNETPPPPPPPPVNHKPQISCIYPPHIYVGGSQFFWCEASDQDGDTLSVTIKGDSHATVNSVIPVSERWDGSPCPSGVHCYRATLWGKAAGRAHIVAEVTAKGESGLSEGEVEVVEDEF